MKKFVTTKYEIKTDKLNHRSLIFAGITDLHNVRYGSDNRPVFQAIQKIRPDAILIAGDLVLGKKGESLEPARQFLQELLCLAPVIYAPGNHEQRMKLFPDCYDASFSQYRRQIRKMGVIYLENEEIQMEIKGEKVSIFGLELPYRYYIKGSGQARKGPELEELKRLVGTPEKEGLNILLAHTPRFGNVYFQWGADLTFSGHYHGGVMRLPFAGGVISPDYVLFPSYSYGRFQRGEKNLIVSSGLGEHTMPFRIFNPRELTVLSFVPEKAEGIRPVAGLFCENKIE